MDFGLLVKLDDTRNMISETRIQNLKETIMYEYLN